MLSIEHPKVFTWYYRVRLSLCEWLIQSTAWSQRRIFSLRHPVHIKLRLHSDFAAERIRKREPNSYAHSSAIRCGNWLKARRQYRSLN